MKSHQTIVVVDDTPANLALLVKMLSIYGYIVRPASTGSLALITIQKQPPDLILLDIMLPDMDGYEICRQLKQNPETAEVPIIFISALDRTFDKVKGFAVGGVDYITKPFQDQEVLARVQTHLLLQLLQQELHQKNQALQHANNSLEGKVEARTVELASANATLRAEIKQRQRHEVEKDHLLTVVRQQSEQLHQLTGWLAQTQQTERTDLATIINHQVSHNLDLMVGHLKALHPSSHQQTAVDLLEQLIQQTKQRLEQLTTQLHQPSPSQHDLTENPRFNLTPREQEVLQLVLDNKTNAEMGEILHLSTSSVKTYRGRVMHKLKAENITDLVKVAIKHGLTSIV